tara:strand:+ start:793 stop:963 length:171 start_codon:yes stop_codon:yes gene_type:complete
MALVMYGHTIYINAEEMYNVQDMQACEEILPTVVRVWGARSGYCLSGDILQPVNPS